MKSNPWFLSTLLLLVAITASIATPLTSYAHGVSAVRRSHESYRHASQRSHVDTLDDFDGTQLITPEQVKKPLAKIRVKDIPALESMTLLEEEFKFVRDTRFIQTSDPNFPRRLTWLYPDDGCYARAEMASQELMSHKYGEPKKIFAFGNLVAQTANSSSGSVQWWYHVAITYRIGHTAYVLDPALNPEHPMTLNEWNEAIGGSAAGIEYAICSHDTFDPDADCVSPTVMSPEQAEAEQKGFLQDEWNRLVELNRDPLKELGDSPPW